jgi:hypothetical protein
VQPATVGGVTKRAGQTRSWLIAANEKKLVFVMRSSALCWWPYAELHANLARSVSDLSLAEALGAMGRVHKP